MPTTSPQQSETATAMPSAAQEAAIPQGWIAWSSLFFAILQSICTFFAAMAGLRLVIGAGALVLSAGASGALVRFHANVFRLPMMALALAGSLLNLIAILRVWQLRARPAARWRQRPLDTRKRRMEHLQFALSIATLVVILVEEYFHFTLAHSL
jgi:hypothetical protein